MCGIFGLLSSREPASHHDGESFSDTFFRETTNLLGIRPGDPELLDPATATRLEEAAWLSRRYVGKDGFLEVLRNQSLRERLAQTARALAGWIAALEAFSEKSGFENQREAELINELIVGARDLVWQIERDILDNLAPVRELLGGEAADGFPADSWTHGWSLNLVLNGLDRLEVRGRDSAGISVYVRFPDSDALERFVESLRGDGDLAREFVRRTGAPALRQGAIVLPETCGFSVLFSFKVANEVGEMGDNVRELRKAIASDAIFQSALRHPGVEIQILAHTRWASNGIVSLENCHPVDSAVVTGNQKAENDHSPPGPLTTARGSIVAVLNGDIDNYQELCRKYVFDRGLDLEEGISTDAKIIPVVVDHHYSRCGDLSEAFRTAFAEFEGSMAIGLMAADRPGEFLFGQKGSGQGMYFGLTADTTVVASEMYGVVELTRTYIKAEGERVDGGELFRVTRDDSRSQVTLLEDDRYVDIDRDRIKRAEITTRDINRGDYSHFLLKEITESVETVRKTLRAKFELTDDGGAKFLLGKEVLDPDRLEHFRSGGIRRIVVTGQGTAAIAGDGVAALLAGALRHSRFPIEITSLKATELSAHHLRDDMSDTLVIAISQSGTTTDTNRTIDLARNRGAWIIGIVNRRNSDLVYKSHGVLYTSDGRDIEMSVASTKAFYAQNVAGQILALTLAQTIGSLPGEEIRRELESLLELPRAMRETLDLSPRIGELAELYAPTRPYWAIVGSGSGKIAADEIRIKLSELCYKAIATDFIEDKKHIDLSSEPLILVCASDAQGAMVSDIVKEVAIFKAHQSVPIVITRNGETRFDPYAAGVLCVPDYPGRLAYLLTTMVGHLFGFHAASSFDALANRLRRIRTGMVREFQSPGRSPRAELSSVDTFELPDNMIEEIREFHDLLLSERLDSCLRPTTAVHLATLLQTVLGRAPFELHGSARLGGRLDTPEALYEALLLAFSEAINELARPIDAIKHQAKTVTVGISRAEEEQLDGVLWTALRRFGLDLDILPRSQKVFISAFEPLVARVDGTTLYRVENLDSVGRPRDGSTVRVMQKSGCAEKILSRCEQRISLGGTKWGVTKSREMFLGFGQTDHRRILILPFVEESHDGHLLLLHLEMNGTRSPETRLRALAAHRSRFEKLKIAITEHHQSWDPALLECIDNDTLFFEDPMRVAEEISAHQANS